MSVQVLLDRLAKVKAVGDGWVACCPAHEDRQPSLTITEKSDGIILIHCFAECAPLDILRAVGLGLTDLFPEPLGNHLKPLPRRQRFPAGAVLECIAKEAMIVRIAAGQISAGRTLSEVDQERLAIANKRLAQAVDLAHGL